jgi:hypothetical protein
MKTFNKIAIRSWGFAYDCLELGFISEDQLRSTAKKYVYKELRNELGWKDIELLMKGLT